MQDKKGAASMGAKGRARVMARFSLTAFALRLHEIVSLGIRDAKA